MKLNKSKQRLISFLLAIILLFQPSFLGIGVLAEGGEVDSQETLSETTTEPQNELSGQVAENQAQATEEQTTEITNENSALVDDEVTATANTGDNSVNPPELTDPASQEETLTPTPTIMETETAVSPTPTPEEVYLPTEPGAEKPCPTPTILEEQDLPLADSEVVGGQEGEAEPETSLTPTPSVLPELVLAENEGTPPGSESQAVAKEEELAEVTNENQALVENSLEATASSGGNEVIGEKVEVTTGDADVSASLANVVNFNAVGQNFWAEVFNLMGENSGDLDFSQIDLEQRFNEALATVIARNFGTGDSSVNISVADFLQSLSVVNSNTATVSNVLDLSAISGQNEALGGSAEIYTGSASVYANLFNLINTNLVGQNFWFGIFNLFGDQNGDLILPYELQFLEEGANGGTGTVMAVNENLGEDSQNLASASSIDATSITNTNQAEIKNTVEVLADSGTNTAEVCGSAEIGTGNASAGVDIRNFVNTNIFGNKFVFLLINVFGEWKGALLGWWGDLFTDGKTTVASAQLPSSPAETEEGLIAAQNQQTGDGSQNTALASSENILEVTNNNQVYLTNEIKGEAISGQNQAQGSSAKIETGNSSVIANIANFVNTNIVGGNFFFGIINIFGKFCGNILFPRPDLQIVKTADRQNVAPGEELAYSISFQNQGRVWAKGVVITDILPAGITFVSATNGGVFSQGKVTWQIGKVSPGEGGVLGVVVRANRDLTDNSQLVNQVAISTSTEEPNQENNQSNSAVTVKISPAPGTASTGVGGSDGVGGSAGVCTPPEAPGAPVLLSAETVSSTEVKLTWTEVDRADYYLVAFGEESGNYLYGSPNVGKVTTYLVSNLTSGEAYYFVVAAVAGSDCPAAGPFSNELSNTGSKVLGIGQALAAEEGQLGGGVSTESEGEVAGAATPVCPWWSIVLLAQALILGGFYALLLGKSKTPRWRWLVAPGLVGAGFLADKLAHHWWIPSHYCPYVIWGGIAIGGIETLAYKFLEKNKGK